MSSTNDHPTKVSVLLSVRNGAKTIERCIESVCSQTFRDISLVCVDDCSSDNTHEMLEMLSGRFPDVPFFILKNELNLGLTKSLNRGLDIIQSPYTARIDADDWWDPKKIEDQVVFLDSHPDYAVVGTNYINHTEVATKYISLPETNEEINKTIFWRNPFAHSCVLYRTDFIKSVGAYNPDVPYSQDYELWVRSLPYTKFHNLQESLCHRSVGSGLSVDHQNKQMRLYLRVLRIYLPKYHRPLAEYGAMIEPIVVLFTPNWIKKLKRRYLP